MTAILAYTSTSMTIALVAVFFVVFPLLAHGLIGLAAGLAMGEKAENRRDDGNWRRPPASK